MEVAAIGSAPAPAPTLVVGVGASAGGVEALSSLVALLPKSFGGAMLVVLHVAPGVPSVLPQILARRCVLHVQAAEDGAPLLPGHVYIAPPDQHLLVEDGVLRLSRGPQVNGHRPAVDPTFWSIAAAYGDRAVGVVLSGTRDDGTAGLARVKAAGGRAFVQDPAEAMYPGMPESAMTHVQVDGVHELEGLVREIVGLARREEGDETTMTGPDRPAPDPEHIEATRFTCPECGGMLKLQEDAGVEQFACSVGHVYSPDSLDAAQEVMVEGALWAGARLLEDRARFLEDMADRASRLGHAHSAGRFRERSVEAQARSDALRSLLGAPMGEQAEGAA